MESAQVWGAQRNFRKYAQPGGAACCGRIFALLKNLYGEQQMPTLADHIQAALMLRYNHRVVG